MRRLGSCHSHVPKGVGGPLSNCARCIAPCSALFSCVWFSRAFRGNESFRFEGNSLVVVVPIRPRRVGENVWAFVEGFQVLLGSTLSLGIGDSFDLFLMSVFFLLPFSLDLRHVSYERGYFFVA